MTPTYHYEPGYIVQDAEMQEPEVGNFPDNIRMFASRLRQYDSYIASLPRYPTTCSAWPEGKLVEGKDFEVKTKFLSKGSVLVAVPLPVQTQESQEEKNWAELFDTLEDFGYEESMTGFIYVTTEAKNFLKQHFTLTRIKQSK